MAPSIGGLASLRCGGGCGPSPPQAGQGGLRRPPSRALDRTEGPPIRRTHRRTAARGPEIGLGHETSPKGERASGRKRSLLMCQSTRDDQLLWVRPSGDPQASERGRSAAPHRSAGLPPNDGPWQGIQGGEREARWGGTPSSPNDDKMPRGAGGDRPGRGRRAGAPGPRPPLGSPVVVVRTEGPPLPQRRRRTCGLGVLREDERTPHRSSEPGRTAAPRARTFSIAGWSGFRERPS